MKRRGDTEEPGALDFPIVPALGSGWPFLPIGTAISGLVLFATIAGPGLAHSDLALVAIQLFCLWFGWYSFDRRHNRAAKLLEADARQAALREIAAPEVGGAWAIEPWPMPRTGGLYASLLVDGEEHPVKDLALIGRSDDCHICLDDPTLALYQAAIVPSGGRLSIVNLQGADLTVNGCPVSETALEPGDVIRLGRTILVYYRDSAVVGSGPASARTHVAALSGPDGEMPLERGDYYWIGRNPSTCSLVLPDATAADRHALIAVDSTGVVTLVDFTSPLGTRINSRRAHFRMLADGDELEFGRTRLTFRDHRPEA